MNERTKALIEINMANSAAESVLTFDKMISPSFERDLAALPLEVRQGYKNILIDKMVAEPTDLQALTPFLSTGQESWQILPRHLPQGGSP